MILISRPETGTDEQDAEDFLRSIETQDSDPRVKFESLIKEFVEEDGMSVHRRRF